jgi:hypothetical protein
LSAANQGEPEGIPYYLPKPLLIIAKNVRHIDESKVGLTNPVPIPNAFDNQSTYADIKANVTVPGADSDASKQAVDSGQVTVPDFSKSEEPGQLPTNLSEVLTPDATRIDDGTSPDSFFTYQIVFVPDLSQKYGLRVKGGTGEMRAAMNLVNGWMYTGMGPFYLKDSSMAQNIMAIGASSMFAGRGAADVVESVGGLVAATMPTPSGGEERSPDEQAFDARLDQLEKLARILKAQQPVACEMLNYAEIYIYEPKLTPDGNTTWELIAHHSFDRHYFKPGLDTNSLNLLNQVMGITPVEATGERSQDGEEVDLPIDETPMLELPPPAEETPEVEQETGPTAISLPNSVLILDESR